jgi:hypothetical protein
MRIARPDRADNLVYRHPLLSHPSCHIGLTGAYFALRAMAGAETIQQTPMPHLAIAAAVAMQLNKDIGVLPSSLIGVSDLAFEQTRIQCLLEPGDFWRAFGIIRRHPPKPNTGYDECNACNNGNGERSGLSAFTHWNHTFEL